MEEENVELTKLNKTLYNQVFLKKDEFNYGTGIKSQFDQIKKENEQLKTLNRQLVSIIPTSKVEAKTGMFNANSLKSSRNELSDRKISTLKGTAYMNKMNTLMDHLNSSERDIEEETIFDWIKKRSKNEHAFMAEICSKNNF